MTHAAKLNDVQLILISTGAQRADGSLLPPPTNVAIQAARITKVLPPLIKRAFVEEIGVKAAEQAWRNDGERRVGLIITDAGRAFIAAEDCASGAQPTRETWCGT